MKSHQSYLIEQVIANFIINFSISYGLSTLALSEISHIPLIAPENDPFHPNMAGDLVVGTIITGLIVTLIVTLITRILLKHKKINIQNIVLPDFLNPIPQSVFWRGLTIGAITSFSLALPLVLLLSYLNVNEMQVPDYLIWHSVYGACIGSFMSYFVCLKAFQDDLTKQS